LKKPLDKLSSAQVIMMKRSPNFVVPAQKIVVGKMGSTYGVRGWLRLFSSTEIASNIFDYQPWFIQHAGRWQSIELERWKHHNHDLIIKIKSVDDQAAASQLTNCEIMVDSTQLPVLSSNYYYWKDLIGCQVITTSGYQLGKIVDMMETGSNDVMVVKADLKDAFGIKERLIPYLDKQVVKRVNVDDKQVEVDWEPNF